MRLLLAALAVALAGCPPRAPPPDLSLDPAELLAQVRAAQARVTSVRGDARVRVKGEAGSGAVPTFVAAKKPDRVYVQTLDFFGNTVAALATRDGALSLYDARERVLYQGAATPENLARLVPVPLSPADLATLLCGSAPLLDGEPVRATPGRGWVELELAAGGRRQVLRVGPGAAVLSSRRSGPGAYDVTFRAADPAGAAFRPDAPEGTSAGAEIALAARDPAASLTLTWSDRQSGVPLEDALFSPPTPRGARVLDLDRTPPPAGLFPEAAPSPAP